MVRPVNGGGNGAVRAHTATATLNQCRLGHNFILTPKMTTAILTNTKHFYGLKVLGKSVDDLSFPHSKQFTGLKLVLTHIEKERKIISLSENVESARRIVLLRSMLKEIDSAGASDQEKETMKHCVSSVILKYLDTNKVELPLALEVFQELRQDSSLGGRAFLLELDKLPTLKELADLKLKEERFFLFYDSISKKCFIMWDMQEWGMDEIDLPFLAKMSGWSLTDFSLFAKIYVKCKKKQSGPTVDHLQACIDMELKHLFSFGQVGIHRFSIKGGRNIRAQNVMEAGRFFGWAKIPKPDDGIVSEDLSEPFSVIVP